MGLQSPFLMACALAAALSAAAVPAQGQPHSAPVITENGYGPLRVGMTWAQARRAMPALTRQGGPDGEDSQSCFTASSPRLRGLYLLFQDGRLGRVSVERNRQVRSARGIHVGSTIAEVRAAYPRLRQEPHHYGGPRDYYLTYWAQPNRRGIRFVTWEGRVSEIHGGDGAIRLIEACS